MEDECSFRRPLGNCNPSGHALTTLSNDGSVSRRTYKLSKDVAHTFLVSSPTRDSVKRKASFPEVTERQARRFCLEPLLKSNDTTMADYQQRVEQDNLLLSIFTTNILLLSS
jgi:hypothetical protein